MTTQNPLVGKTITGVEIAAAAQQEVTTVETARSAIKDFLHAVDRGYLGTMPDGFNASAFVIALRAQVRSERRHKLPTGECPFCDGETTDFHPSHDASPRCESGKRNHCSCDSCF